MTRSVTYSEKVIGGIQIAWGALALFVAVYGLKNLYDLGVAHFQLSLEKISIWKLLKTYHSEFLLAILSLISGLLLILNKKSGWQLAVITSFVTAMLGVINLINFYYTQGKLKFNKTNVILSQVTIIVIFFLISCILLLKPFRTKYNPTKGTWWAIIIIIGLLLGDKIVFDIMK